MAAFDEAASRADVASPHDAVVLLLEAARLYRDDLLPGCYDDWLEAERRRLRAHLRAVLRSLVQLLDGHGRRVEAIAHAGCANWIRSTWSRVACRSGCVRPPGTRRGPFGRITPARQCWGSCWGDPAGARSRIFAASTAHEPLNGLAIGPLVLAGAQRTHANLCLAAFSAGSTVATFGPRRCSNACPAPYGGMVGDDPVEDSNLVAARELAAGIAGIVVSGFATSVLFPSTSPAGRVLIMSVVCGVLVALFTDWRARAGVTVGAVVAFVSFVAPDSGAMTADGAPWSYTPSFALAVLLGCGLRRIVHSTSSSDWERWEDSADEPH